MLILEVAVLCVELEDRVEVHNNTLVSGLVVEVNVVVVSSEVNLSDVSASSIVL